MKKVLTVRNFRFMCTVCKMICLLGVMLLTGIFGNVCVAADTPEQVKVAVINYPSYLQKNADGSISGYAYEYLKDIQEYTGWQYEFIEMSFAEASNALARGEIDLVAGNQYTEERVGLWDYSSRDMGEGGTVLCVRSDDMRYSYNDYDSYNGMRIAGLKGSIRLEQTRHKLAEYGASAVFVEYDTDEESKAALQDGAVDAILMSTIRCEAPYKILARINTAPLYFCTNKQRPELKAQLDEAMEEIHLENPYYEEQLDQKYYGDIQIQLAFTQEEKNYIAEAGVITVAISVDLAPVEYYSEQKKCYEGIVPDSFRLLEEYSGLTFQFVPRQDLDTGLEQMKNGELQLIASVVDAPEIASSWNVELTNSYYNNSEALVANRNVGDYKNTDCTIVLRTGYPLFERTARARGYTNFVYADSFEGCLRMVSNGKADLTIIPSNSTSSLIRKYGYENLDSYTLNDSNSDFCIGVSKYADPRLLSVLNKSLASITKEQQAELLVENLTAGNENITVRGFIAAYRFNIIVTLLVIVILIAFGISYVAIVRVRDNKQLKDALQRADAANRIKSDFMARMSHDMRTPMNGILGLTYLMDGQTDLHEVKKELPKLREAGEYLLQLINDVLDVNRVESGAMELIPKVCDEELLFTTIIDMVKPQMEQKHIRFSFVKKDIEWKHIILDEQRVKQIFVNLLSNAVKFTPDGGQIDFSMELISQLQDRAWYRFIIQDNGIGIEASFLPRLFEPFAQENRTKAGQYAGTGLGLAIVKRLVELMEGSIEVESTVDVGTKFTVCLNFQMAEEAAKLPEHKETESVEMPAGLQVLLCEDHPLNAQIAIRILEKKGATVTWKENGKLGVEAFEESEEGQYDVILMDIRMPLLNGLEAAKAIRELHRADAKRIPIIAMTANAFEEDVKASLDAGMNAHLAKPVEPEKLYRTIAEYTKERGEYLSHE